MKLIELLLSGGDLPETAAEEFMQPSEALKTSFGMLTCQNEAVAADIAGCLADTRDYFSSRGELLDRFGLKYSSEAEPWLCVIAAVGSAVTEGYMRLMDAGCSADEFTSALREVLRAAGMVFSFDRLCFDPKKDLASWAALFNEYAGQSGITLYFIDLYGEAAAMGASRIADYAEAAGIAALAGLKVTCRPG